ncbi:MAG: permease-like cell division protein FtsX [bacterium]
MKLNKVIKTTMTNIKRSGWSTVVAVIVMTLTFFMSSLFVISAYISNRVLGYLESKAQITIFFKDSVLEESIFNVKTSLEQTNLTAEVIYVSKEDALKIYMGQHKNEPLLLESISSSIFPASLDVRAKDIKDLPVLAGMLEKAEGKEEVVYYKDVIATFQKWSNAVKYAGFGLVGILALISILVVLVTVSSAIHSKGEEIMVMRLIGADNWYIQGPFLVQGIFYGLFAAIISTILISALLPFLYPYFGNVFSGIPIPAFTPLTILALLGIEILFGTVLGAFGSLIALRRYLKI